MTLTASVKCCPRLKLSGYEAQSLSFIPMKCDSLQHDAVGIMMNGQMGQSDESSLTQLLRIGMLSIVSLSDAEFSFYIIIAAPDFSSDMGKPFSISQPPNFRRMALMIEGKWREPVSSRERRSNLYCVLNYMPTALVVRCFATWLSC